MSDFPNYEAAEFQYAVAVSRLMTDKQVSPSVDAREIVDVALGEKTLVTECACGGWRGPFCDCSGLRWRWEYVQEWQSMSTHPSRNEEADDERLP